MLLGDEYRRRRTDLFLGRGRGRYRCWRPTRRRACGRRLCILLTRRVIVPILRVPASTSTPLAIVAPASTSESAAVSAAPTSVAPPAAVATMTPSPVAAPTVAPASTPTATSAVRAASAAAEARPMWAVAAKMTDLITTETRHCRLLLWLATVPAPVTGGPQLKHENAPLDPVAISPCGQSRPKWPGSPQL